MSVQSYRSRMRIALALALVAAIAAGFIGSRVAHAGEPGANFWLVYAGLLAVAALAFAATVPWWRKLDDMQRTGHLVSWYWGGMAGGVAVMMALVAGTGAQSDLSQGALYTVLGQAVGFLLFFGGWRLRRGGPAA